MKISSELKECAARAFREASFNYLAEDYGYVDFTCLTINRIGNYRLQQEWEALFRPKAARHSAWLQITKTACMYKDSGTRLAMYWTVAYGTKADVEVMRKWIKLNFDKYVDNVPND